MQTSSAERSERGFTLIEVLVAIFVLAVAVTGLMAIVSQTIVNLNRARRDIEASDLAQEQLRTVALDASDGKLPELGTREGNFEGDDDLRFELKVEAYGVPLEGDDRPLAKRSSIFEGGELEGGDPAEAGPSVRRVTLRVYRQSEGIESALPLTMFVTKPAEVPEDAAGNGSGNGSGDGQDQGQGSQGKSKTKSKGKGKSKGGGSSTGQPGGDTAPPNPGSFGMGGAPPEDR